MQIKIRAWDDVAQKMSYGEIELFYEQKNHIQVEHRF